MRTDGRTKRATGRGAALALLALLGSRAAPAAPAPDDPAAYVALATTAMRRARITADGADYERARRAVEHALALDPDHYEALRTRAWVLLGLHDFAGALAAAEEARRRNPADWWNHATLADALVELGEYARAARAAERMVALRPGLPAYARIAFLRSLHGDRAGALEAYDLAVRAGSRRDPESLAWALVHLGHERFAGGDLAGARQAYSGARGLLPDYYLALAGLARVSAAEGALTDAIALYERATAQVPAPDLVAALGDVHAAAGDPDAAERQWALVEHMGRVAEATGGGYGRQLALFYADHDRRLPEALRLARAEAAGRGDIYTDDALAWALVKNGQLAEAKRAAQRALRLGTADAVLHYHAGMIAAACGRERRAARHLAQALALNPHFDLRQGPVARATLAVLTTPALTALAARPGEGR